MFSCVLSQEDAIDSALSCLEIPDVYDTLEDIRTLEIVFPSPRNFCHTKNKNKKNQNLKTYYRIVLRYNPAGLSNVEGQAKNFEQVAQGVMSSLLMVVSAGEGVPFSAL